MSLGQIKRNTSEPSSLLMLSNRPERGAEADSKIDHLDAFASYSRFKVYELPILGRIPERIDLDRFDFIVAHFTLQLGDPHNRFLSMASLKRLGNCRSLKIAFLQDEYQNISAVHDKISLGGFDLLFSLLPETETGKVYPPGRLPNLRIMPTLAGYIPDRLLKYEPPPLKERPIRIGYRGRRLPYWLGTQAQEKVWIAEGFRRLAEKARISHDISCEEHDRKYGRKWIRFLTSCKAMLGVESGAGVFDFSGAIRRSVIAYTDDHPQTGFDEVRRLLFAGQEDMTSLKVISPQIFEAIALRTALLLFEGSYSGILQPGRHYFPLKKDFSNSREALNILNDDDQLQAMADTAFRDIALNPSFSYRSFIAGFDEQVIEEWRRRKRSPVSSYDRRGFKKELRLDFSYSTRYWSSRILQTVLLRPSVRRTLVKVWKRMPMHWRERLRPLIKIIRI